jgi:hypothetical protein
MRFSEGICGAGNATRQAAILLWATLLAAGAAQAQCTVTASGDAAGIRLAQSLAARSDDATVRQAYAQHRCNIRKLLHGGGRPCRNNMARDHVTIRVFATATYHVFPVRLPDGLFCTTD